MKHSRRLLSVLLTSLLFVMMVPAVVFADGEKNTKDIVVLFTNDTHCTIDKPDGKTHIGFEGVAGLKDYYLDRYDNVALVDAGDHVQGDLAGAFSKGSYMVEIMNTVGYDFAAPGNHEFDFSLDYFLNTIVKDMDLTYLSCNFKKSTGEYVLEPYKIVNYNGTKVAYLGISTPETFTKSTPSYFQDKNGNFIYSFCQGNNGRDLYRAVQNTVNQAKREGAEYIIAIGHLGIDEQSSPWTSVEVAENTTGIDVFIDGHSHSTYDKSPSGNIIQNYTGDDVLIAQTGTALANVGKLTIDVSSHQVSTELIPASDVTTVNARVEAKVNEIREKVEKQSSEKIGISETTLSNNDTNGNRLVRKQETTVANLCTDAYKTIMGTDIGLIQGGGVRADIKSGDVSYGNIVSVNPWNNNICVKKVTGQVILDALEFGARTAPTSENGGFLHVSGITYDINTTIKSTVVLDAQNQFISVAGERRVQSVKVNGQPIDPKKYYTVASTEYILRDKGDGMTMFASGEDVPITTITDSEAVVKYVKENLKGIIRSSMYGKVQGRINFVDKKPDDNKPVEKKTISSVTLSNTKYVYNGKKRCPNVTVKDSNGKVLVKGTDYTVKLPSKSIAVGTYKVTVTGKGNYKFTKTLTYVINPRATSITKVKARSKGFRVYWKKVTKQCTGYQIRYSKKSSMAGAKIVTIKNNKTTTKKIKKLSRKKKYYIQVRVYRKINGKNYYSSWSKKKSIKTKK